MLDFFQNFFNRVLNFFGGKNRVKVPTVLQMEATECGAASLSMIFAHYGLWLPLETVRIECGVSRDGSKASFILRAARHRGCQANGYKFSADRLKKLNIFNDILLIKNLRRDYYGDSKYFNYSI